MVNARYYVPLDQQLPCRFVYPDAVFDICLLSLMYFVVLQHHVGLSPTSGTCLVEMWHIIVTKHHLKHHTTCFKWDVDCMNLLPKLVRLREVKVSVNGHD